jgi:hypothetical protein
MHKMLLLHRASDCLMIGERLLKETFKIWVKKVILTEVYEWFMQNMEIWNNLGDAEGIGKTQECDA